MNLLTFVSHFDVISPGLQDRYALWAIICKTHAHARTWMLFAPSGSYFLFAGCGEQFQAFLAEPQTQ